MAEQRPERPQRKGARPGGPANNGLRFGRGLFGWVLFIGLAIMLFMPSASGGQPRTCMERIPQALPPLAPPRDRQRRPPRRRNPQPRNPTPPAVSARRSRGAAAVDRGMNIAGAI